MQCIQFALFRCAFFTTIVPLLTSSFAHPPSLVMHIYFTLFSSLFCSRAVNGAGGGGGGAVAPYLISFHVHNMHVQYIECLYKCDCCCCLFGKLFNITLAFVCIESAYVGWWCGNRVHNEYNQSPHFSLFLFLFSPASPLSFSISIIVGLSAFLSLSVLPLTYFSRKMTRKFSVEKLTQMVWYGDRGKNNMFFSFTINVDNVAFCVHRVWYV